MASVKKESTNLKTDPAHTNGDGGPDDKEMEATAAEAAEVVLEDEESMEITGDPDSGDVVENGDDDESGKSKKDVTKKNRYFIPSRLEFRQDRIREQQERTVIVGPTTLDDLVIPKLMECMRGSMQFFIRFFKDESKTAPEGETKNKTEEEFKGHVEIRFHSVAEAEKCVKNLSNFRKGVVVRRITYEYSKEEEYLKMRKIGNPTDQEGSAGHRATRMVALAGLTPDISREMIIEQVSDAVEVMIPKLYTSETPDQLKGYAYIELPTPARVKELENKEITLDDKAYKVYTLMEIPALDSVIRRIDKERPADTPTRAMESAKKERLRLLLRYATHYERVEDLPETKLEAIKKRVLQIRKRLKAEGRRATPAARGAARGGRGANRGTTPRGTNRGRGGQMGYTVPNARGGYYPRGRGGYNPTGYATRPMSAYGGGYGSYDAYGYRDYDDFDYGHGDYGGRMVPGYGPPPAQRAGRGMRRGMAAGGGYYGQSRNAWYD